MVDPPIEVRPASSPDGLLVGREQVVAELGGLARAAATGTGSLVLLTGEAGIGKTSVAREVARQVRGLMAVTWGNGSADGSAPPLWPWRDVIPADGPGSRRIGTSPWESTAGAQRLELLRSLRDGLFERSRLHPMLHVIEDLQWADVASVALMVQVGAAISDRPLFVLGTVRTGERITHRMEEAIEEARRSAVVRELAPLATEDVETLVRSAGLPGDPGLGRLVRDRTGGNPLFVNEVVRAMKVAPADLLAEVVASSVPTRVGDLIGRRLARLPAAVAELLVAASVLGTQGEVATLATVTGQPIGSVVDLLEQGRAAALLDAAPPGEWRFRHALIRDAVAAGVSGTERARLHVAVLEALATGGSTPPAVLAHHALSALPLLDVERVVALASRAGEAAFSHHAYEEALSWSTRALEASRPDRALRWRAELLVQRGECHRHLGDIDEARRDFLDAAEATEDPGLLARSALGYADPGADLGIAYRTEDPMTATLLTRAISAQPAGDSVIGVLLEARLAAELYFSDRPGRARELAGLAVDRAARIGDPRALCAAGAVSHDAFVVGQADLQEQLEGSAQLREWAEASGSAAAQLTAHRARVLDLLAAGDMTGVDAEVLAFRRVAEPLRVPAYRWWLSLWSAMRALLEGRHDVAEVRGQEACDTGSEPFPVLSLVNFSFLLFFLRREQGRLTELEQITRDYAASHADVPAIRVALAFLLAETDRPDETRELLRSLSADLDRLHDRNWPASWFQLARAAAVVGDDRLAAELLRPERRPTERCVSVSLATVCLGSTDLAGAWLLQALGDFDAADEHYRRAEEVNGRIGARSWLAQARADHARLLLERGRAEDRDAARELVRLASDAAAEIGLRSVEPLIEELVDGLGRTTPGAGSAPERHGLFRRSGSSWELEFAGRSVQVAHARGMSDLAVLLTRPGQPVSVLELLGEGGIVPGDRGALAIDERARREIGQRLRDLESEVDEAEADHDAERAAAARAQRQRLAETVARDLGLGGRSRLVGDPVERGRKTVSTRIRRTIASIGRHHPELGRHLERSIDTGAWCAYRPAEQTSWTT